MSSTAQRPRVEGSPTLTNVAAATSGLRFSVVVPAYNEVTVLADCLSSLQRQSYPGAYEIIVVDNGSTDGTAALAKRLGARVVSEPRHGVCFARQRGLSEAGGEIVVSTDADTVVSPGWLQRIDDEFAARPEAVGVAGSCVYVDGPWWGPTWSRLLFGAVDRVASRTGRVVYVTATNLAFRRSSFPGYDTRLTQGGDELDVLRQLRRRGLVLYTGDNAVSTSSRRLERGLVYTVVVSLCFHYLLGYAVNRLAGRPVLGTATAFRAASAPRAAVRSPLEPVGPGQD